MNVFSVIASTAGGAVGENRLVKPGGTAGQMVLATAATDLIVGVNRTTGGNAAAGERMSLGLSGLHPVVLGGTVAAGAAITSDANGAGVAAAPSAGVNNRVVGFAYEAGVSGDIIRVLFSQHTMQG